MDSESMDLKNYISNQTDFALRMTKQLFLTEFKEKNMVYSPLSIHVVLSLIAAGTKGPPQDQLLSFLKSKSTADLNSLASDIAPLVFADGSPKGGPCLNFANGFWVDQSLTLKSSFKELVDTFYRDAQREVDFQTKPEEVRLEINSWAEKETKGLIKEVLPFGSINSLMRLNFANALYFKGAWEDEFDASLTRNSPFYLLDGRSEVMAPFMTSYGDQFVNAFDGFKVLKLQYEQGEDEERRFSMCLFLPDKDDGLPALVERVCSEPGFLDRHLPARKVDVGYIRIPRFKITSHFKPSEILGDLGLVLPFSGEGKLTDMVDSPPGEYPHVSKIFHSSFIEVNEEGTKAAAVTDGGIGFCLYDPIEFKADHPFLFLIREEMTGAVLFIGQVLNPLEDH